MDTPSVVPLKMIHRQVLLSLQERINDLQAQQRMYTQALINEAELTGDWTLDLDKGILRQASPPETKP